MAAEARALLLHQLRQARRTYEPDPVWAAVEAHLGGADGITVHLRADFLAERRGETFVAEVKAGAESVKVTGRATRRQLLEYLFAFEVDGVLLVDMQAEKVRVVDFPQPRSL